MSSIPYPNEGDTSESTWKLGFAFPSAFVQELRERFPDWDILRSRLEENDEAQVWSLLRKHRENLVNIRPEVVIQASESNSFDEIIARAKEALEFEQYILTVEERHFPEKVAERKRQSELLAAQWS